METYTFGNDSTLVEFEIFLHRSTLLYAHDGFYTVYLSDVSVSLSKYVPWKNTLSSHIFDKSDYKYLPPRFDTQKLSMIPSVFSVNTGRCYPGFVQETDRSAEAIATLATTKVGLKRPPRVKERMVTVETVRSIMQAKWIWQIFSLLFVVWPMRS